QPGLKRRRAIPRHRAMTNPAWAKALKACADPQRARHFLGLLTGTSAGAALRSSTPEQARIFAALFSGSQALSNCLVAHPDWLDALTPVVLKFPRRKQGLRREVNEWLKPLLEEADFAPALRRLREFKQREMLRLAARPGPARKCIGNHAGNFGRSGRVFGRRVADLPSATERASWAATS